MDGVGRRKILHVMCVSFKIVVIIITVIVIIKINITVLTIPNCVQMLELLVEKCLIGLGGLESLSPGNALRRVFECVASGLMLPGKLYTF